ncbi:MAG: hypothetical protein Q4B16_04825 [Bacteroidia bacterium]|nr:hypothetical protein [Bacteroidia bacterium]
MRRFILLITLFFLGYGVSASGFDNAQDTLQASVVRGERSARSVVKEAARDFSKNYADYYASFLIIRTIKCCGKYREVQGAVGVFASLDFNQKTNIKLYWDDRNAMGRLYVCDTFVSESLFADKNEVNPVLSVESKDPGNGMNALKVNYANNFDVSALDRKRAVEIFSPLNPKMTGSYIYKSSGTAKLGGRNVRVINFTSNAKEHSIKERILCSGQLFIDGDGRVQKIVVKDMDDRFTRYVRNFSKKFLVTPYTYTITYGEKNGKIYTESIRQELSWRVPEDGAADLYSAEANPFRNPFKNCVETDFTMKFSEPVMVKPGEEYGEATPAYSILCYNDSRDFNFWQRILSKEIDLVQLMKDTGTTWDILCGQTQTRQERDLLVRCGNDDTKVLKEKKRSDEKTSRARETYQLLFKKDYTDGFK